MATNIGKLFAVVGADISEWETKMEKVAKPLGDIGKKMSMYITAPLVGIGVAALKMSSDFEQALANAASVALATGDDLKLMEETARKMGTTTVFSAKQAAEGMYFMASAGWNAKQMAEALGPVMNLAGATASDLAFTTDTVVAALNQFGLKAADASRVTNVYAAAIGASQATLQKLSVSMAYLGPIAGTLGMSIEGTSAALSVLYDAGYDASMAGSSLRMALAVLLNPTKEVTEGLAKLGLKLEDVSPTTHNFGQIVRTLGEKSADAADLIGIFGVRSGPALAAMLMQGADKIDEYTRRVTGTEAAAKMMAIQMDTLQGQMKILWSNISEVAIQIGKILIPIMRELITNHVMPAVKWFQELSEGKKKLILVVAGLAAALGPLLVVISKVLMVTPGLATAMGAVTNAGGLMQVALRALSSPVGALVVIVGVLTAAALKLKSGIDNLSGKTFNDLVRSADAADKKMGNMVGWRDFMWAAKVSGLDLDDFTKRLIKNKDNVVKTIEELKNGEIKNTEDLKALYYVLEKAAVGRLQAEKEAAEGLIKVEEKMNLMDKADAESKIALAAVTKNLTGTVGDQQIALELVNKALSFGKNLRMEDKEALEKYKEQLERNIETTTGAAESLKKLKEELGLTFASDIQEKINKINYALSTFGSQITPEKQAEMHKELRDLNIDLQVINGTLDKDMANALKNYKVNVAEVIPWTEEYSRSITNVQEIVKKAPGVFQESLEYKSTPTVINFGKVLEDTAVGMADYWTKAMAEMITSGINMGDVVYLSFSTLAKGVGDFVGGIATTVLSGLGPLAGAAGSLIGATVGALISGVGALFGIKTQAQKEAEAAAKAAEQLKTWISDIKTATSEYGTISDETAKKIQEADKSMQGFAAVSKYFGDVIKDVGVTQDNINQLWARATDIIGQVQDGYLTAADGTKALDDSFKLLLQGARDLNQEGSAAMIAFILSVRESGLEVKSVTDYVIAELGKIPDALTVLIENQDKVGTSLQEMGTLALATFESMLASGVSWTDAVGKMAGPLALLRDKYAELGITADGALAELFKIVGVTEANKELFSAIDANNQILKSLGNTGWLTADSMAILTRNAVSYYDQLKAAGLTSDQALRSMGPTLQSIYDYAKAYGIKLDDNTQLLINQAKEVGIVKDAEEQRLKEAEKGYDYLAGKIGEIMDKVADKITRALRGGFDTAYESIEAGARDAGDRIYDGLTGGFDDVTAAAYRVGSDITEMYRGFHPVINVEVNQPNIPGMQSGGIAMRPMLAKIAEVEPEVVMPLRLFRRQSKQPSGTGGITLPGGGGSGGVVINYNPTIQAMDSQDVYKFMATKGKDALLKILDENLGGIMRMIRESR
jgi:TP901 family phage tail tape measure protein